MYHKTKQSVTFIFCLPQHFYTYPKVDGAYVQESRHSVVPVALSYKNFKRNKSTGPASAFDDTKFYEWLAGLIDGCASDSYIYKRTND